MKITAHEMSLILDRLPLVSTVDAPYYRIEVPRDPDRIPGENADKETVPTVTVTKVALASGITVWEEWALELPDDR